MMESILQQLYCLKRDKVGTYERPHKPVLLLSVLDLFDQGKVVQNKIEFSKDLETRFKTLFEIVKKEDSKPTIQNPFFYMSGEPFWDAKGSNDVKLYSPGNVIDENSKPDEQVQQFALSVSSLLNSLSELKELSEFQKLLLDVQV